MEKHIAEVNSFAQHTEGAASNNSNVEDGPEEVNEQTEGLSGVFEADHEAEYLEEDRQITVTVEAVDISRDGFHKARKELEDDSGAGAEMIELSQRPLQEGDAKSNGKDVATKTKTPILKRKQKKFRYESKAERKATRYKQRSKNTAKARARRS